MGSLDALQTFGDVMAPYLLVHQMDTEGRVWLSDNGSPLKPMTQAQLLKPATLKSIASKKIWQQACGGESFSPDDCFTNIMALTKARPIKRVDSKNERMLAHGDKPPISALECPYPHQDDAKSNPRATIDNVMEMCRRADVTLGYDIIKKRLKCTIPGMSSTIDNADNVVYAHMLDLCNQAGIPSGPLADYLLAIADRNVINPVRDWIEQDE